MHPVRVDPARPERSAEPGRHHAAGQAFLLVLAALALYTPLIGWGVPHATAPDRVKTFATDEILPLEGLAEMRSTFIERAPDRNLGYPWFHYAVVAAAQAPYVGWLWITGNLGAPAAAYPFGLADPVRSLKVLTVIGRIVSVLMGAGIVVAVFVFARTFWGTPVGLVAAVLTLLSYPMFYYARTGNLDVPAFFWSAWGLAALARSLVHGLTTRRAIGLGICAALAVATKDQAVLLFVPALAAIMLPHRDRAAGGGAWRPVLVLGATGLMTYIAATGMLFDPARQIDHVTSLLFEPRRLSRAALYYPPADPTWAGTWQLLSDYGAALADMLAWPVLAAGAAGAILAVSARRLHLWWLVPFLTTFVVLVRLPGLVVARYLLPLTIFTDAFAGVALIRLKRLHSGAFWLVFVVLAGGRLAVGVDLSVAQWRETRLEAAGWLAANYQAGDVIGYFGVPDVLPHLDAQMATQRLPGVWERAPQPHVLDTLAQSGPRFVVIVPDWTSRDGEHSADCPPDVYAALLDGRAGYSLAAHFRTPRLLPSWLSRRPLDSPTVSPPVRIFERKES